jgi:PIN domain nuclease of toxin-antitoxin system
MSVPLLDTHAWVWWVEHDARLPRTAFDALERFPADSRPYVCDISLWEVAMLVERRRLSLRIPLREWLDATTHPRSIQMLSMTPAVAAEVAALPDSFHRDPADRIIVASSRALKLPLLTHDRRITRSRLVTRWTV